MSEEKNENGCRPHRPRKQRKRSVLGTICKVLGTLVLIGVLTCAMLACFATVYIKTIIIPQADMKLTDYSMDLTSYMYYFDPDTGERKQMQELHGDENRVWISYDEIPRDLIDAAVAIEDKTFWTHKGVNWKRTIGAVGNMFIQMKDTFGGSTITQQLIKNVTGNNEGTVKRKITEIFRALEFEKNYSKETTMEWYLNYIYLGENCNGVYTASYAYFGKHVSELSLAECASLIGITNNPSIYNPYLSLKITDPETGEVVTNVMRNKRRQETILYEMLDQELITQEEYDAAVAEELVFVRGEDESRPSKVFSWYEDQVINDVVEALMEKYDLGREAAIQAVYSGGLEIETCYNPKVQERVDAIYENLNNLPYISPTGQQLQSATTVIDNSTGNIVAMAGGVGEKTASRVRNRATAAVRQPGSAIKPLAVYAPAIELGLIDPATVIDDVPINLNDAPWPKNSYSHYRGRMTVLEAVEDSSNPVAVRVMRDYITPQVAYDFMTGKLGFTTLIMARENSRTGKIDSDIDLAPMSLGGLTDGVKTSEMAAAYAAFPRMGVYTVPRTYTRVYDADGELILENEAQSHVAMKESTAYYINYLLQNVVTAGTGTEANFSGMSIAGKTGTTTNNYDRWFVGYTPYYTAAVWTGYDQNERLKVTGNPAAKLWNQVMSQVHAGLSDPGFAKPSEEIVTQEYCLDSGLLPNEYCPNDGRGNRVVTGSFIKEDVPTEYCTLHVPVWLCTEDPVLDEEGNPTGMYHIAGEHCPTESKVSVAILDYGRPDEGVEYESRDDIILKSKLEALGTCHVHTEPVWPEWPPDWPWGEEWGEGWGDPDDPATWPGEGSGNGYTDPSDTPDNDWHWPWENLPEDGGEEAPMTETPTEPGLPAA